MSVPDHLQCDYVHCKNAAQVKVIRGELKHEACYQCVIKYWLRKLKRKDSLNIAQYKRIRWYAL